MPYSPHQFKTMTNKRNDITSFPMIIGVLFVFIVTIFGACSNNSICYHKKPVWLYPFDFIDLKVNNIFVNKYIPTTKYDDIAAMLVDSIGLDTKVTSMKRLQTTNIVGLGEAEIIEVCLQPDRLPVIVDTMGYIVHKAHTNHFQFIPANRYYLIPTQANLKEYYFATLPIWRNQDAHLYIFDFCDNKAIPFFSTFYTQDTTKTDYKHVVFVIKKRISCLMYEKDSLDIITDTDINNDSFLDVQLKGRAIVSCKSVVDTLYPNDTLYEVNNHIEDIPPDTINVNIVYLYNAIQKTWILQDSLMVDFCKYNVSY